MKQDPRLEALRQAYERLSDPNFPDDSGDEQSSALHAELVEFDGYVAGRITTLLGGGRLRIAELQADGGLRRRLEAVATIPSPGGAAAKRYLVHLDALDSLLATAREFGR